MTEIRTGVHNLGRAIKMDYLKSKKNQNGTPGVKETVNALEESRKNQVGEEEKNENEEDEEDGDEVDGEEENNDNIEK